MTEPLCSIIIPTYNHGKFIERSIKSALNQTYPNKEIIIVDDGSTDDTAERVKKFGDDVIYIQKKNTGRGDNRNVAIRRSQGKYIQFLDADDYISENKLAVQVPLLEKDERIAVVYSDCSCSASDGTPLENVSYPLGENEDPVPVLLERTLFGIHAGITRRDVIMETGLFDTDPLAQEDWDLWLKIALKGYKYKYIPGNLAHYDQVGSSTVTNSLLMFKRTRHMLDKYMNDPEFLALGKPLVNKFVGYQSLSLGTRAYNNGWWKQARKYFFTAIRAKTGMVTWNYRQRIFKSYFYQLLDFIRGRKQINPAI